MCGTSVAYTVHLHKSRHGWVSFFFLCRWPFPSLGPLFFFILFFFLEIGDGRSVGFGWWWGCERRSVRVSATRGEEGQGPALGGGEY